MLGAEFPHSGPIFLGGYPVVGKVAVVIGLGDQGRNVPLAFRPGLFQSVQVEPGNNDIVGHFLRQDAGIVSLHGPGLISVVIPLQEQGLFPARGRTGGQNAEGGGVGAVLHEEGPVGAGHGVHQHFRTLYHFIGGCRRAVAGKQLLHGGPVHVRVPIAQHIGAVGAHQV